MPVRMPELDAAILGRRDRIVAALAERFGATLRA